MNEVGRYRKTYARIWRHPGFVALSEGEKVLALYLISGPQTNRLGLYCLSIATAAEDLGTLPQTLSKRLGNVCQTFGWLFDKRSRVVYIPSWFKWNPPENVNVMKGSLKDLNEIPSSGLIDAFARNIETLSPTLHETFIEGLRQRLPKGMPIQDQYQYQETESGTPRATALRAASHHQKEQRRGSESGNGSNEPAEGEVSARHLEIAAATTKLAKGPLSDMVDAYMNLHLNVAGGPCSRAIAIKALNQFLTRPTA